MHRAEETLPSASSSSAEPPDSAGLVPVASHPGHPTAFSAGTQVPQGRMSKVRLTTAHRTPRCQRAVPLPCAGYGAPPSHPALWRLAAPTPTSGSAGHWKPRTCVLVTARPADQPSSLWAPLPQARFQEPCCSEPAASAPPPPSTGPASWNLSLIETKHRGSSRAVPQRPLVDLLFPSLLPSPAGGGVLSLRQHLGEALTSTAQAGDCKGGQRRRVRKQRRGDSGQFMEEGSHQVPSLSWAQGLGKDLVKKGCSGLTCFGQLCVSVSRSRRTG